jgi:hypothetical protein
MDIHVRIQNLWCWSARHIDGTLAIALTCPAAMQRDASRRCLLAPAQHDMHPDRDQARHGMT